jgi:mRNA interferase MazF
MLKLKGQVWLAEFHGEGSEQNGFRPCIIVQNDENNTHSNTTIVCPITSVKKRYNKTHVPVKLKYDSIVLCEQIKTMDKKFLKKYLLTVSGDTIKEVESKIRVALGM